MPRQLVLPFMKAVQRACICGACKTCFEHEKRARYRLRKFIGALDGRNNLTGEAGRAAIQKRRSAREERKNEELERRLVERFKQRGWD